MPSYRTYRNNLAYILLTRGRYQEALNEYGRLEQYPLAALEAAKAHWTLGQLDEAAAKQAEAIRWLDTSATANLPSNQGTWYFETEQPGQGLRLVTLADKLCYAKWALAATRFLQGKEKPEFASMRASCGDRGNEIERVVGADLRRYAENRPELSEKSRAFADYAGRF